jgi:hypothetical protein
MKDGLFIPYVSNSCNSMIGLVSLKGCFFHDVDGFRRDFCRPGTQVMHHAKKKKKKKKKKKLALNPPPGAKI